MPQCAVVGCNNTHRRTRGKSIKYHRFPGDNITRHQWLKACRKTLNNWATARICSRHFSAASYERDVQHELLGLPTRCRLKRGAIPDKNLPSDFLKEDVQAKSAIAVLLAVGLVPRKKIEGLSKDLDKMQIMENVGEGCDVNPPSSPGHADEHQNNEGPLEDAPVKYDEPSENDDSFEIKIENNGLENQPEDIKEEKDDAKKSDDEVEEKHQEENSSHSSSSEPPSNKRKLDYDSPPMKRLKTDIEDNFMAREKIIGDYFEVAACNNLEQIQSFSDQVLSEIKTLNELAKEKEQEWNQLLHMKKLKEELLLRLQRKRQVLIFNDSDLNDIQPETNGQQSLQKCNQKANMLRELRAANLEKLKRRTSLLNNAYNKQKPVVDVQSIIADYRQSHPESVPRRGRRIRHSQSEGKTSIFGFSGGSLIGPKSGLDHCDMPSQNGTQDDSRVSSNQNSHNRPSGEIKTYKDILLQCARLSQAEKTELQMQLNASKLPPPYPEVTVHPVTSTSSVAPTNSLLHGILTKTPNRQKTNGKTKVNGGKSSFSPTLARLLTAPDRSATSTPTNMMSGSLLNASNIALSAIFPGSKVRNEITITPVGSEFETPIKRELMEDESEDPVDRLVIDETLDSSNLRKEDNKSEDGEDVPQCQGCNQRAAQFVCAGCGNQWYCSRDCQVTAWDDHSEVCSG
ncbi:unnamed protein product [Ceutorhynchus assimilis]|uniref:THAP-type domain-containing protein n=1 Tax=Ceutorhynchus assimilis TaxID=467358 RepID=A0A9N9QQF5_9CUCU|nr:unnamed protein product [Ceutorhynchus assimilis]